jgi:5S rRNA maturation endonuclease (ribonuclease M5)
MDDEERVAAFENLVGKLRDKIILVEGKNDEAALHLLGCKKIVKAASKKAEAVIDEIERIKNLYGDNEIVILTDFDENGERMANFYFECLRPHFCISNLREDLRRLFGLVKIEELNEEKIKNLRGDFHGKGIFRHSQIRNICESRNKWLGGKA